MKLPSTRALADELNVSRNTMLSAYRQLLAEGYLESREGIHYVGWLPASVGPYVIRIVSTANITAARNIGVDEVIDYPVKPFENAVR